MENARDAISKELVGLLGESRSQMVQKRMTDFADRITVLQSQQKVEHRSDLSIPQVTASDLGSKGFSGGPSRGAGLDIPNSESGSKLEDIIVVLNGTGYLTNMLTDGRLDAV